MIALLLSIGADGLKRVGYVLVNELHSIMILITIIGQRWKATSTLEHQQQGPQVY